MDQDLKKLLGLFIKDKVVDKAGICTYTLERLQTLHRQIDFLANNPATSQHWNELRDFAVIQLSIADGHAVAIFDQILSLHEIIEAWITDHVDSPERFEFSVLSKAAEISSGNDDADYFNALIIRHDQLLAAVTVFETAVKYWQELLKMQPNEAIHSKQLTFFEENSIEGWIYACAQKMYALRNSNV